MEEISESNKSPGARSITFLLEEDDNEQDEINGNLDLKEEDELTEQKKINKTQFVFFSLAKSFLFMLLLFFFLISLNFMSIGFTLITPYALKSGKTISFILSNPLSALSIGIISTAFLENSTVITAIVVSMVGAGIIPSVKSAIPIIMGSNIGTGITNFFIALTYSNDIKKLKRAFIAATLNDMFNILATLILLPLEIYFNLLSNLSDKLIQNIPLENTQLMNKYNIIERILSPITSLFIQLDEKAVDLVNYGSNNTQLALRFCGTVTKLIPIETNIVAGSTVSFLNKTEFVDCDYLFMPMIKYFGDVLTGFFMIAISLLILLSCLYGMVNVLSLIIVGPIANWVRKAMNASFPGKMRWFTNFFLFSFAVFATLIVQSSNIITGTLVPLFGMGMVSLDRVYVMTLGSNVGTTVTGLLSAFTQPQSALKKSLQLAFVYTLFNIFGVLFWLIIPFMRLPKILAIILGNIIFEFKWFIHVYLCTLFFCVPLIVIGLNLLPFWLRRIIFFVVVILLFKLYIILLILRSYFSNVLPNKLKSFAWLKTFGKESRLNAAPSKYSLPNVIKHLSSIDLTSQRR
ncbi:unnamed protein product [Brachionus calyciflorus]|uniref:Uncharacterized protein n=1 Tax=Brachionus calyciflorus TaxID=104777 RepID=A0A813UVF1_9BILA|nr:unnamed protein product [Brachionus calyciflorus]